MRRSLSTTANTSHDKDEPLVYISVKPTRPFFFSGETFEAKITLENVRPKNARNGSGVRTAIDPRDRARASIDGYAQRNTAGPDHRRSSTSNFGPRRLGLIGKHEDAQDQEVEVPTKVDEATSLPVTPKRKLHLAGRSQSVDFDSLREQDLARIPGPWTGAFPRSHPHARQISIATIPSSPAQSVFGDGATSPTSPGAPSPMSRHSGLERIEEGGTSGQDRPGDEMGDGSADRPMMQRSGSSSSEFSGTSNAAFGLSRLSFDANVARSHRQSASFSRSASALRLQTASLDDGSLTILWAQTRLVGRFTPSSAYIPPDPLLPLKSLMLHQPVGSGSLPSFSTSTGQAAGSPSSPALSRSGSRWNLSFGTGTLAGQGDPTLTGSLWGLAKGLIGSGSGGSLEEERRKVWNSRELPVLESMKSLLGVEIRLGPHESRSFTYTLKLPDTLAPTFRGKALRFAYELSLSLNIASSGLGTSAKQKIHEVTVPIKVYPSIDAISGRPGVYDILDPIVHTTDQGIVTDCRDEPRKVVKADRPRDRQRELRRLQLYAERLSDPSSSSGAQEETVDEAEASLSEDRSSADEIITQQIRSSKPAHFDIHKHGEPVAEIDLVRSAYRAGDAITGVVKVNQEGWRYQVLKVAATLFTEEIIPESLLPPSPAHGDVIAPVLRKTVANDSNGFASHLRRLSFRLDIPTDITPTSTLKAGPEGDQGGVTWAMQVHFLMRKRSTRHHRSSPSINLRPETHQATSGNKHNDKHIDRTEVVHCTIPVTTYPGERQIGPIEQGLELAG